MLSLEPCQSRACCDPWIIVLSPPVLLAIAATAWPDAFQTRLAGRLGLSSLWWNINVAAGTRCPSWRSCFCTDCTPWWFVCCAYLPPPTSIQLHLLRPSSSRPTFLMYPVHSPKQIVPVLPSCTCPACLFSWTLCTEKAVHANSRWNICLRSFLSSLWRKLSWRLQYTRQLMSRSSLMSNAFAIFYLPPILFLNPLQFLPMIQNIPGC